MPVRIRYSHLPVVARAIERKEEDAIAKASEELIELLKGAVWRRDGYISASVKDHSLDPLMINIWVGEIIGGLGFYSGFQEFGTIKQAPRPVVGPTAHLFEPRLVVLVTEALREAARAK